MKYPFLKNLELSLLVKNLMKISLVLGIDIGGTNTIFGFITKNGIIVFQEEILDNFVFLLENLFQ